MNVHFIAIGGSVMHQLAIALQLKGYTVTGSDDEIFEPALTNLKNHELLPSETGWFPGKINSNLDAVILGMHAREDNPEIMRAKELNIKIYSFPEYIYQESKNKVRVAVSGSHGKTTTTSMIMHVLKSAGKEFDYLAGARLDGFAQSVNVTSAPLIICEADEYPASVLEKRPKFHFIFPHIAIITGIAWDHINVFPTFAFYIDQFKIFIETIEPGGILIYNETDEVLSKLIKQHKRQNIRYQPYRLPTYFIEDGITQVMIDTEKTKLKIFGNHNLLNLQAAFLACKELEVNAEVFAKAITDFAGAANRLELIQNTNTCSVYRDFAHAPSKVEASIKAVKQQFPERRLAAILELHTYSSLNENFMEEYRGVMEMADEAVVFYSAHALELKRLPDLNEQKIKDGFEKEGLIIFKDKNSLGNWLLNHHFQNYNLLFMSSGNYEGLDIIKSIPHNQQNEILN